MPDTEKTPKTIEVKKKRSTGVPFTKDDPRRNDVSRFTHEQLVENGRKGGLAAQEKRRQNATFKQALEWALEMPAIKGVKDVEKVRRANPDITNREAMAIAMVAETIRKGDVRAFVAVRDTTGELPAQTVNVTHDEPFSISIETVGASIPSPAPAPSASLGTPSTTLGIPTAPLLTPLTPDVSEEEEEP